MVFMYNLGAALIFFTRLPFWRILNVPKEYFNQVINYWSAVGWVTSSVMAGILWLCGQILPLQVAVLLALISRLLVTGALHEDGLADFFDGFGAGGGKNRILSIMKDSHIGTYGVVGLIFYFLLLFLLLSQLPLNTACLIILAGDPLCKFISSLITLCLNYARNEETSKSRTIYKKMQFSTFLVSLFFGIIPLLILLSPCYWFAIIFPILVFFILIQLMKNKIQGYTGDCCGALFLLCELSFYLGIVLLYMEK